MSALVRKFPHPTEHAEQSALIEWHELAQAKWPELSLLHAIPNAGAGAQKGQAGKMRAEGVKKGVPDLSLPVRRAHASGLYIEMKRIGGEIAVEQRAWLAALKEQGFETVIAYGMESAVDAIERYLKSPK